MYPKCVCNLLRKWRDKRGTSPGIRLRHRLTLQVSRYCLIILQLIFIRPKFGADFLIFCFTFLSKESLGTHIEAVYQGNIGFPCMLTRIYLQTALHAQQ